MTATSATEPRSWRPLWWRRFRRLPKPLRVGGYTAVVAVLLLVVATLAGVAVVRRSFPQTDGTIEVPGLGARVEVVRDDHGIPQIYASTTEDLMYAQGYVSAQERFFEMDVRRHYTAGRLAELFGARAVDSDVMVRTMGWRRVAARELPLLDPSTRVALDAYARGVNAYLGTHSPGQISLEYTLLDAEGLGYTPEPWTAIDSLAWLKAMAWDLRGNMQDEIARAESIEAVGTHRAAQLFPAYPYGRHTPIVDQGAVVDGVFEPNAEQGATRRDRRPPPFGEGAVRRLAAVGHDVDQMPSLLGRGDGVGSNSWVVDGTMTATGKPMLADDPHLGVSLPGVWMQVGLHCTTISDACPYDVSGFSFSGLPGVVIGHNEHIAWGFTNLSPDVTDLYVERVVGDRWRYDHHLLPLSSHQETIKVAGGDDVTITVRSTAHGPLLSDADDELEAIASHAPVPRPTGTAAVDQYAVALSWTALTPHPTADALLELDRAHDWDSFRTAAESFAAPAQNMVYADTEGHIGYQAPGVVPIRRSGDDGRLPSAGWRPENDWSGQYVPFDALPTVLDPKDHFVVAANQAVTGPDYPYFLTDDWDAGYRSQRIRDLLSDGSRPRTGLTVDDLAAMQLDDVAPMAATLLPYLLRERLGRGYYASGQRLLSTWDQRQGVDSGAAAYFNAVWRNLLALTFHDELPEAQWPDGGQRWMAVVTDLLREPRSRWWDDVGTDEVRETRDDILTTAMRDARDELTERLGPDPADWRWGDLHRLRLDSPSLGASGNPLVEGLFNRGGFAAPGGSSAVDASSWDAAGGYDVVTAPSMRMVASLADFDDSRWIDLGGESGHAYDPHYTDQVDLWLAGRTLAWPFTPDAVHAAADHTLVLEPAPGTSP